MQPSLESERLRLRPFSLQDAAAVQRLAGDRRIASTTTTIPHPYPDGAAEKWISKHAESLRSGSGLIFASTLQATGELVGAISLLELSTAHARAEVGYWVGVPYWGLGYATEAVRRLIPYATEAYGVTRLLGRCLARNPASARVMEKAGLSYEGRLVKHVLKNDEYEDVLLYGLVLGERGAA